MSKAILGMIDQLGHEIEAAAGAETARQVMAGSEKIKANTKSPEIALWAKGAMERFDGLADEVSRLQAMTACGLNCSAKNHTAIDRGLARRAKYKSEDEFLDAEMQKPQTGTRVERDGNFLYQIYTPASFRNGMRCFCGLMFGLPEGTLASRTYCNCSKAFATAYWQGVLGRPVTVDVLETAISGGSECRFRIDLQGDAG
jgi:hypothetical protein